MKTIKLYELKKIQTNFPSTRITDSESAANFIRQFYGDDMEIFESCFLLMLNRAGNTIAYAKISQGGISSTIVDPKLIGKYCIDNLSTAVILAHNHPSGQKSPSHADIEITKKVKKTLEILDVSFLDHVILTSDSHYSMADNGDM
jgi:DNA repair protein RadC